MGVFVTCQAKGGHPIPDIGLTLDGVPAGSKDFRNIQNSFNLTASEEDNGKRIICTSTNKVGTSTASMILHVQTPPTKAAISGPQTIQHEDESIYECAIDGGNPAPEITWTIKDHLGNTKEVAGEMIDQGLSRMTLKTGTDERMLSINCVGSNNQGIVSHTMHVNTHYLPQTVQITGPTTATPGQFAHFTCVTTETFPVPALTWKIEKSGDIAEVTQIDIPIEETTAHAFIECSAMVEGLGIATSKKLEVEVILPEKVVDLPVEEDYSDYSDQEDATQYENKPEIVELVKLDDQAEYVDEDSNDLLWISLKPEEDVPSENTFFSDDEEEDFLRSSNIPDATVLKQAKNTKPEAISSPLSVTSFHSSSSKVSIHSLIFFVGFYLSTLLN